MTRLTLFFAKKALPDAKLGGVPASVIHLPSRSTLLSRWFVRRRARLYNGRKWKTLLLTRWHRG
jgi:hypothetical protein